jgi:hypothetical protein
VGRQPRCWLCLSSRPATHDEQNAGITNRENYARWLVGWMYMVCRQCRDRNGWYEWCTAIADAAGID